MSLLTYTFFPMYANVFSNFLRSSCYFLPFGLIQYQVILGSSADEEIKEQKEVQGNKEFYIQHFIFKVFLEEKIVKAGVKCDL